MNILLLQLKRIGDLILTTPAITALRKKYPDADITLAVSSECAELLSAISNVDHVLIARRNLRDVAMVSSVAGNRFDYCIDLTLLSGARKRVASYRVREQSKTRAHAYTDLVGVRVRDLHTIDYNMALLEPLEVRSAASLPHLDLPQIALEKADRLRRDWKIRRRYVILHPGSARREKLWDPARWAEVIEHFGENHDSDLVLTSGPSIDERTHIREITQRTRQKFFNLSGQTDLLTLAALISDAQLLMTVDSAPVHFAASTHTPQVVLFGPTNPFHWRPRSSPALILHGSATAPVTEFAPVRPRLPMSEISTEAVISAMDSLLPRRAAVHSS